LTGISFDTFAQASFSGADFQHVNLTNASFRRIGLGGADFRQANLTDASFNRVGLSGANFADQDLRNTSFYGSWLTGADFSGADVRGTDFDLNLQNYVSHVTLQGYLSFVTGPSGSGISPAQLYSTASYEARDLRGIRLGNNNLVNGNFVGQDLSNASFRGATLTGADFREANLTGAYFLLAKLTNANFSDQELVDAYFFAATLTGADFTGADVRGAQFGRFRNALDQGTGVSLAQLYSTASYQSKDLSQIGLSYNLLAGADMVGQNLTGASLEGADLNGADLRHANLSNCYFEYAELTDADFTGADARGARDLGSFDYWGATTTNLIQPDGYINGLDLDAGTLLVVRDFDGIPFYGFELIPITVDQRFAMAPGGTLRMVFEADAWDSTISYAPGIPVTLGGTLELTFADDVNLASQLGRTFDLFNWDGVSPAGAFAVSSPYAWDLSNLYTTGEITLAAIPEPCSLILLAVVASATTTWRRFALLRVERNIIS
jgi:uncharacterized protein YjbI with pentapeptide repeats